MQYELSFLLGVTKKQREKMPYMCVCGAWNSLWQPKALLTKLLAAFQSCILLSSFSSAFAFAFMPWCFHAQVGLAPCCSWLIPVRSVSLSYQQKINPFTCLVYFSFSICLGLLLNCSTPITFYHSILWFCDLTFLLQSFSPPLSVVLLQQLSAAPFCAFPVFYSFLVKSVAPVRGKGTEPCWGCVLRKASDFVIFRRASCEQQEVFFPIGKPVFLMNLVDGFLKFYLCKSHFLLEK